MYLGIDTSCYTTSVALIDDNGNIYKDLRQLLQVKDGERGLQQSKAVWQHMANLPVLFEQLFSGLMPEQIKAVAVSSKPRPVDGSYLPVFMAGFSHGKTISSCLKVPLYYTSHQEGHIMAACNASLVEKGRFLTVHLSGGTSEILITTVEQNPFGLREEIIGKTLDLHAGQFVDRVGVAMGLAFPCGPALESLARMAAQEAKLRIPIAVKDNNFSFSGPESCAQRLIDQGQPKAEIARAVEACICNTLYKILDKAIIDTRLQDILIVGGVAANQYIREMLKRKLNNVNLFFADAKLSSDNAVGVAKICLLNY